jgi:amino acid adenylation domain-containing protein
LLQTHHIISDHIGLEIVTEEVMAQLQARAHRLPLSSSYRNYVAQALALSRTQDVEGFFRGKLADVTETTAPFGLKNVRGDRAHIQEFHEQLAPALSQQTRALARRFGVSAATMFHAAWALVVAHTSGREDVVFGSVLLGRLQVDSDMQRTVGMFINTLPLRLKLGGLNARDLIERTQRELVELLGFEQASLAIAQRCSGVEGSSPLFTALLNYRHSKPDAHTQWNDLEGMRTVAAQERTNYPIALSVDDLGEAFAITAQTDERVDPRRMTHYLIAALESLSVALEQAPKTPALHLTILPEHERRQVISLFNDTHVWYPRDRKIHEVFADQVRRSPDAPAVVHPSGTLTYAELNARANQLVRYLLEQGVAAGEYVPVVMPRSLQMLIVQLALLKCGGVYVPIDPELPAERRMFMIRDCAARRIVSDRPMPQDLQALQVQWIDCEDFDRRNLGYGTQDLDLELEPLPPAYVMYTSGSTGVPKGVVVPHHAVIRLAINNGYATIGSADCIAHYSNPAFDASTFEIWGALLNGARVLIVPQADVLDAEKFAASLEQNDVTLLYMSVGLFNQYTEALAEVFTRLRCLMVGGDALEPTAIGRVLRNSPPAVFLNVYGPTECTTFSTRFRIESLEDAAQSIPIGQPIANARIYILNERREPVPIGATGELYIGGDGVASGYLNRPELTEQRFVADPFSDVPEARLYKTGDLGRWRADGAIEFLGRNDNQVKIRGFRIELGEIEARLLEHTSLRSAFVAALGDGPGEKRLVAYVVPDDAAAAPGADELRAALKASLPEYMLPSAFVTLDHLPLNANGKVDRRALPAPDLSAYAQRQYEAPRGEVEEILAGLWQELLRVERVGRHDNFFELGGHSLLIVQMLERLRRLGLATEVRRIFDAATLADLAICLSLAGAEAVEVPPNLIAPECSSITPALLPLVQLDQDQIDRIVAQVPGGVGNVQDIYPLAPLQEGMLFHHLLNREGGDAYVLPTLLAIPSRERLHALISALQATIDRHDILRTAVLWEELPRPVQVVYRQATIAVEEVVLDAQRDALEQVSEWTLPERQRMDLRDAPLARLQVAEDVQRQQLYVLLQLHHIVVDGTSFRAVLGELIAQLRGEAQRLPASVPYRNHVANALKYAQKNDAERFFVDKLADVDEPTAPFGLLDVHGDGTQVDEARTELEAGFAQRLRRQAGALGVSAATLFHAAWALVTAQTSGREDVVFGTVLLGRMQSAADAQQMLGLFINTLPLRLKLQGLSAKALVQQTQRELLELMTHEQASLAVAQSCSGVSGNTPLFSALLNYRHGDAGAGFDMAAATGIQVLAGRNGTNYPVTLSIDDLGQSFALIAQTDRRIDPRRINGYFEEALRSLVEALERSPHSPALSLPVLPNNERWQVLEQFNATVQPFPRDRLVHELFEAQVERTPDAIALAFDTKSFSYAEINRQANRLAWHLLERNVGADRRVAICLERSPEMVIGLLAIMKAGATYVPLDPNYPAERLQYMIEDAAPDAVLTHSSLVTSLPVAAERCVLLDIVLPQLAQARGDNLGRVEAGVTSESLVYVIYTSGSTGRPKGTGMPHRAMVNLIEWHRTQFADRLSSRVLQFAALSFDVAFQEIFTTLCTGGTLMLLQEWMRRDVRALLALLSERRIERLFLPPLMLQSLAESHESAGAPALSLRDVITAGEQLRISPQIVSFFERFGECRLHNHYGPTETHVVTSLTLPREVRQWPMLPTIGRPIANSRIYILEARHQPVALGAVGEIYIGGENVARGYLHRAELTAQRFIDDPFVAGARMYKTGDLGRWLADGTIEYLGRNDDQVKIRGFRVELGEVESQLLLHPAVKEVAVVAREDAPGQKRLVAYLIAHDASTLSTEVLREYLQSRLPEHMVPSAYVPIATLPLTPSGKLDRRALPAPELDAYVSREYEPPRGEIEEILANIWQELLGIKRVGRRDNFFELGGHSLLIVQMMERLRRVGLNAEVRRVFDAASLADVATVLTRAELTAFEVPPNGIPTDAGAIEPQMLSLVTLESEHIERIAQLVPGGAANIQDIYPLAPLQEGILFHHLMRTSGADTYAITAAFVVPTRERVDQLLAAMQAAVDRHDVLRTAVLWEDLPRPVQVVYRRAQLLVEQIVLDADRDPRAQIEARMAEARRTFDLRRAPLLRLQIAQDRHSDKWYLIRQLHHIVDDGMSGKILATELLAHIEGRAQQLPKPVPYRNYVAHALHYARTQDVEAFFRNKLGDVDEPTAAFGLLDVHQDGSHMAEVREELGGDLSLRVRAMARRQGVSVAALFHAAWSLVVASTSGRDDVVFGTVLLGRLQAPAETQRMLGLFINTLPLRLQLQNVSAKTLLERTQRELIELLQHEQASLALAQRCSAVNGSVPLFNALLNYRHGALTRDEVARAEDIELLGASGGTNYPLTLSIDDLGECFMLTAQTDLRIDPSRLNGCMRTAMHALVSALENAPQTPALALPVLSPAERAEIDAFNATAAPFSERALLHELFEAQVVRSPDAVALIFEGASLTYAQVNARANRLARFLQTQGVGPDQLVGLYVDRSFEMVIGLLGILKAGGAYVPLDPGYPSDRLTYMLEDAAPRVVLTQSHLRSRLPVATGTIVELDGDQQRFASYDAGNVDARARGMHANGLAYVIYTSGSTGRPKGAMNEHQGVINRLEWMQRQYQLGPHDRVLQKTPYSFDVSVWEFFWTLMSGAQLVIARPDGHKDPRYLRELIEATGVTTLHFVPSMLQLFLDQPLQGACPSLRHIVCSGEELTPALENRCLQTLPQAQLSNLYGPTEAAVDVTYWECSRDPALSRVPIGRPIANIQIHILGPCGQPVPIGVVGEIFIAGVGVGRGYLNRPELTAQRFMRDPFANNPHARMYKTGDLGCWRADGAIEYLGRNDHQVKIRGFRIELGEIEAQIKRDERVKDAVVVAREEAVGEKRLVAYLTPRAGESPTIDELRAQLRAALPDHMVPSAFVTMETFPLTASGKLDRRALPAPELDAFTHREYEPPQGEIEEILAGLWQELLRVERVGRNDNFFELGGHSLLIMQLVERLRRLGLSTHAQGVFDTPVLAALACGLTAAVGEAVCAPANLIPHDSQHITPAMLPMVELEPHHLDRIVQSVPGGAANVQDIYPLAPLQEGILFHHTLDERDSDAYVVPVVLSIDSLERLEQLREALQAVIDRHDVLRTAILWEKLAQPVQVVYRAAMLEIERLELDATTDVLSQVKAWVDPQHQRMNIRRAPLLRLQVAKDPSSERRYALLQFHHIAIDHVTFEIIMSEAAAALAGRAQVVVDAAPYREHVARALEYARSGAAEAFFRARLADISETTAPFGCVDVHGNGTQIEEAQLQLDAELSRTIRETARRAGVSAATLFHAAYALVMSRTSGRNDVVFGTVLLGRLQGRAEAQRTLGMFINTLPVRVKLQGLSVRQLIERTQRELIALLPHEQASLALAQRCSGMGGSAPLFSSLLNYRHSAEQTSAEWLSPPGIEFVAIQERTNYPVALAVDDLGDIFGIKAQTDRRIDPKRMTEYLHTAVAALVQALREMPHASALSLSIVPANERQTLLEDFNATHVDSPSDLLLYELFEDQVARTPDAMAVVCRQQQLTFAQLDRRANAVAHDLRRAGVGPDRLVGVFAERSIAMVVALIGVWKAGAAYVPLDAQSPRERLAFLVGDCAPAALLVQPQLRARLPQTSVSVIELDDTHEQSSECFIEGRRAAPLGAHVGQLAYVIYTSGSTGQPKGVMIDQRGVINLWHGLKRMYGSGGGRHVAWNASFTFDASVQQFVQLLSGQTLFLVPEDVRRDATMMLDFIAWNRIEAIDCTPSQLRAWVQAGLLERKHVLRTVLVGGEAIDRELWDRLAASESIEFHNVYGPTECVVDSTSASLRGERCAPHIGSPMENRRVYILDGDGAVLPLGAIGEIYIAGAGIARGYLNRPDLTAERFLPDPFAVEAGARMYRTGDLGRWTASGAIEYFGRNDQQVKVRGYRIELSEIEAQLARIPAVRHAVVLAREDEPGEQRLVAYIVARDPAAQPGVETLRASLKEVLPEYMVPGAFVNLDALPLNRSGKVDRRSLPAPEHAAYSSREYTAPQSEVEQTLAHLWARVLGVERVGRDDNFFELGGHSLLGMKLTAAIAAHFDVTLSVAVVFRHPSVLEMAQLIESSRWSRALPEIDATTGEDEEFEEGVLSVASGGERA